MSTPIQPAPSHQTSSAPPTSSTPSNAHGLHLTESLWRPRVIERLTTSPPVGANLVHLSAPAGFGKTTALMQWAEQKGQAGAVVVWITCDDRHKDADFFVESLVNAVITALRDGGRHVPLVTSDPEQRALPLAHWMAQLPGELIVMLDDCDCASSQPVDELIDQIAWAAPAHLTLVLAGRASPPRSFTRLELAGRARLVDADALRFSAAEAQLLLGNALPKDTAAQIINCADGWPFALQLARLRAQARQGATAPDWEIEPGAKIPRKQIFDYLADEVIAGLPKEVIDFLMDVCVLEQLDTASADALRQRDDSLRFIRQLLRLKPIVTVDDSLQRARLHPLLRDYLRDAVDLASPGRNAVMHLRAAQHLSQTGQLHQAVNHAVAGGRLDAAAEIIERAGGLRLVSTEGALRSRLLLEQLPDATLNRYPRLRLLQLGCHAGDVRAFAAQPEIDRLANLVCGDDHGDADPDTLLDLEAARCLALIQLCDHQLHCSPWPVIAQARRAMQTQAGQPCDPRLNAIVLAAEIYLLQRYGPIERCERRTVDIAQLHAQGAYTYNRPWLWMYRARNALARLDLDTAEQALRQGLLQDAHFIHYRQDVLHQLCAVVLGRIALLRGDPLAALGHLGGLAGEQLSPSLELLHGAHVVVAECEFALGNIDRALEMLRSLRHLAEDEELPPLGHLAAATEIELTLRAGQTTQAQALAADCALPALWRDMQLPLAHPWMCVHAAAKAQFGCCLAAGDLPGAQAVTHSLQALAKQSGHRAAEIDAQLMTARAALAQGLPAGPGLNQAIHWAAASGAVQLFFEAGPEVMLAMRHWAQATPRPEPPAVVHWAQSTLAAWELHFRQRAQRHHGGGPTLTPRELDVLCHLAQQRSTKLIARTLMVSPETVKHHLKGIYSKLGVGSRDDALAVARRRALIP